MRVTTATSTSMYTRWLKYPYVPNYNISNWPFQRGKRVYTSEYDVCRRQILTFKVDPRADSMKLFLLVVDP